MKIDGLPYRKEPLFFFKTAQYTQIGAKAELRPLGKGDAANENRKDKYDELFFQKENSPAMLSNLTPIP